MTRIGPAVLALILVTSCAAPRVHKLGCEAALNAGVHYLDTVLVNALNSLELIASTPEAGRGDWTGIKRYLVRLEPALPGVYFFVLPNGDYYTTTKDYTHLNLSNRPYFTPLFAGHPVMGFPIYSRSTGIKSVVMAAPIVVDGRVIGALGISVFLESLNARLSRALGLPPEYAWSVINADGDIMLDSYPDFIFTSTLTQRSPSLGEAVPEALANDSGTIQPRRPATANGCGQRLPRLDWRMFLARVEGGKASVKQRLKLSLDRFVPDLQKSLNRIDDSLIRLLKDTRVHVEREGEVRELLRRLLAENIHIVDAAYVDVNGVLRYAEPGDYRNFENRDISAQAHVAAMRRDPKPLLSSGFFAVEDFLAVVDSHPVKDGAGHFAGSINLLIRPELMIDALLKQTAVPEDYELWIMQTDGMIIYDQDKTEIGKMLFTDPLYADYASLRQLSEQIVLRPSGEGSYIFLAPKLKEKTVKTAIWRTIRLNGREWRVVLAYPHKRTE